MCSQRDWRKRLRFPVWYHSGCCDTFRVLSRILRRVRMSSANVNVNRWLFGSTAQASASPCAQAGLYFSTNAAQVAQSPISASGTVRRDTAIHDPDRPSVGECRDAKIGIRAIRTRDKRTTMPLQTRGASTGRFSSAGTSTTIRAILGQSGTDREPGTQLSCLHRFQINDDRR